MEIEGDLIPGATVNLIHQIMPGQRHSPRHLAQRRRPARRDANA